MRRKWQKTRKRARLLSSELYKVLAYKDIRKWSLYLLILKLVQNKAREREKLKKAKLKNKREISAGHTQTHIYNPIKNKTSHNSIVEYESKSSRRPHLEGWNVARELSSAPGLSTSEAACRLQQELEWELFSIERI